MQTSSGIGLDGHDHRRRRTRLVVRDDGVGEGADADGGDDVGGVVGVVELGGCFAEEGGVALDDPLRGGVSIRSDGVWREGVVRWGRPRSRGRRCLG